MLNHLFSLVFPDVCAHCRVSLLHNERFVCSFCFGQIHFFDFPKEEEEIADRVFYGKVRVEKAFSLFYFIKGGVSQSLIHHVKYKNKAALGVYLGKLLGAAIMQHTVFQNVDVIVPVPLTKRKQRKRGYNQSEKIAKGIAAKLQKPLLADYLLRVKQKESQTQYNKFTRWQNINHCFEVNKKAQQHFKHILLVDDVITTGATLESCVRVILESGDLKVSIASLAFAPQPL